MSKNVKVTKLAEAMTQSILDNPQELTADLLLKDFEKWRDQAGDLAGFSREDLVTALVWAAWDLRLCKSVIAQNNKYKHLAKELVDLIPKAEALGRMDGANRATLAILLSEGHKIASYDKRKANALQMNKKATPARQKKANEKEKIITQKIDECLLSNPRAKPSEIAQYIEERSFHPDPIESKKIYKERLRYERTVLIKKIRRIIKLVTEGNLQT